METKNPPRNDKKHALVRILWKDAFAGPNGWFSLDEYQAEPALPVTVGWLLEGFLDGYVTTADTYLVQGDEIAYYNIGHIPVEMIITMEVLEIDGNNASKKRRNGGKQ